jgi:hypothetical protein
VHHRLRDLNFFFYLLFRLLFPYLFTSLFSLTLLICFFILFLRNHFFFNFVNYLRDWNDSFMNNVIDKPRLLGCVTIEGAHRIVFQFGWHLRQLESIFITFPVSQVKSIRIKEWTI